MINDIIPPDKPKPADQNVNQVSKMTVPNLFKRPMPAMRFRGRPPGQAEQKPGHEKAGDELLSTVSRRLDDEPPPFAQTSPVNSDQPKWFKRRKIQMIIAASVLLLASGGFAAWKIFKKPPPPPKPAMVVQKKPEPVKPLTVPSPLTGVEVSPELAKRPVTSIIIENSTEARPQSGLRDAGIIFESIAEGGITRLVALYQESQPAYVGPVRSLRPYFLDFIAPFDASVAHVGGSRDALEQVRAGMKDMDQFFNGSSFMRITERYAPHNVYTSFDKLNSLNQTKGFTTSSFTAWPRKKEAKLTVPTAKTIDISVSSSFNYMPHYDYNPATNTYLRSQSKKPHVDILNQDDQTPFQLNPKVVLVLAMSYQYGPANDGTRSFYTTTGQGKLWLFQDGSVVEGTWSKENRAGQFSFKDTAGAVLKFNPGQTWVSIVTNGNAVKYQP